MAGLFKKKIEPEKSAFAKAPADKPVELKSLLKWEAPVRPFKKRDRDYYTTIAAIVFLLAVILLFLKEWLLIAVMVALMFVAYVLATVQPEKTSHEITTRGVVTSGKAYLWKDLKRFWFSKKWSETILNIDTNLKFPSRLMMLLGEVEEGKIKELLQKQIQYEVPETTFMDRSAKWLSDKIPLERE
ncbi:MAG: hypothetical protein NTZ93_01920 [Candidatus Beckwithbacteria bacterium]|nr:hypothetical protein [Candidatus Beckwithbacteria bacterium]